MCFSGLLNKQALLVVQFLEGKDGLSILYVSLFKTIMFAKICLAFISSVKFLYLELYLDSSVILWVTFLNKSELRGDFLVYISKKKIIRTNFVLYQTNYF